MVKAQEWLDKNYPKEKRKEEVSVSGGGGEILERHLDLSDFSNIVHIYLENHQLTSLDVVDNHHLKKLFLNNNKITANLDIFSHTTTIKYLYLSNNDFVGSLEKLKNNQHLSDLYIDNNKKITEGLEWLRDVLDFRCEGTVFAETLKPYANDVLAWKLVNHPNLVANSLENLIERLDNKIGEMKVWGGERAKTLKILTDYREETVQVSSHNMVKSIAEENQELKSEVKELERKLEQLKLEAKIEVSSKK